jgi:predicted nucleic acid-binding protein
MNDKRFVDANILIYAHDRAAGVKHQRARSLMEEPWNSGDGVLSTQVPQEKVRFTVAEAQHFLYFFPDPHGGGERGE